jgi:hypothetical protein
LFWQLLRDPYKTKMVCPVVIHDFLYSKECKLDITRREADVAFFEMMINFDYIFVAMFFFAYVRLTGWLAWKRK